MTDDVIAVLLGFDAPIILRLKANGCFEFVGEAYVYGLMNGEAILGPLPSGWQVLCPPYVVGPPPPPLVKNNDFLR